MHKVIIWEEVVPSSSGCGIHDDGVEVAAAGEGWMDSIVQRRTE